MTNDIYIDPCTYEEPTGEVTETKANSLIEAVKMLSDDQCRHMIKVIKVINGVSDEQGDQLIPLRQSGLTIEEIAEKWGVEI